MVTNFGDEDDPTGADQPGEHAHHWLIASQDGPSSRGICKACGEVREFTNGFRRTYAGTFRPHGPVPPAPG